MDSLVFMLHTVEVEGHRRDVEPRAGARHGSNQALSMRATSNAPAYRPRLNHIDSVRCCTEFLCRPLTDTHCVRVMRCSRAALLTALLSLACVRTPAEGPRGPASEEPATEETSRHGAPTAPTGFSGSLSRDAKLVAPRTASPLNAGPSNAVRSPAGRATLPPAPFELLREALEREDYSEARALLELIDDVPARELVVGYVEMQLGHYDWALSTLTQAKERWPSLGSLIEPWRRHALLRSTDWDALLPEAERSTDSDELLLVARRLLERGQPRDAARLTQRAAAFTRGSKRRQAEVRALRAQVSLATDQRFTALMDWRWLAVDAPLEDASQGADAFIEQHFPKTPLKAEQRYLRAVRFANAGRVAEADAELERVLAAPFYKVAEGDALHLQGMARYRARQFEAAAEWLLDAAQKGSHQALRDTYYAARALSRAGRVVEAIALFEQVAKSTPKGPLTQSARFHIGSEYLVLGQWQAAVEAHDAFLNNYGPNEHTEAAQRERAIAYFALGEYQRAAYWFARLRANDPKGRDANLYQLLEAVAREHLGDMAAAVTLLRNLELNAPLSFAGQQAQARLHAMGESVTPLLTQRTQVLQLAPFPSPVAALETVGLSELSERALSQLETQWLSGISDDRKQAQCHGYGQLAAGRRRYLIGIDAATRSGFFSRPRDGQEWLWRCVYPTPYARTVAEQGGEWQVSPALVYAVMRQESGFHSSIESPAAARGLMQIIPPTADRIADELGERAFNGTMDNPHRNIRFGTFYLRKLLDVFDDNPAPAIAAYNAGPQAAIRWYDATGALPLELFVARIPFSETRNYVQRVLGNLRIYEALYPEFGSVPLPLSLKSTSVSVAPMSGATLTLTRDLY